MSPRMPLRLNHHSYRTCRLLPCHLHRNRLTFQIKPEIHQHDRLDLTPSGETLDNETHADIRMQEVVAQPTSNNLIEVDMEIDSPLESTILKETLTATDVEGLANYVVPARKMVPGFTNEHVCEAMLFWTSTDSR